MRPEISVPYLEKAIRLAAVIGAPVVNTDEGVRPECVILVVGDMADVFAAETGQ